MAERLYDLVLADESTVKISMAGVSQQGDLWIHVYEKTFMECAMTFCNPLKTSTMSVEYDETISDRFEDFTNLISVSVCDSFIKVCLERGAANG